MGIRGSYYMIADEDLNQMIRGEKSLFDMDMDEAKPLEIDKSYQLIHYLFCRVVENGDPPGGYVVPTRDDNEMENESSDMASYVLTAQQVKEASGFLNAQDDDTLRGLYDFKAMRDNRVYPLFGNEPEAQELYDYLYEYLVMIRDYLNQAAEKECAIVFCLI